ncbi:MAG: hypothetical protein PHE83_15235 [Opitutaceae bacterium]|nr:hypothetical protein [Opitutaceae bacterium]
MSKQHQLVPISIGDNTYTVISKGHHDIHEFMQAVRQSIVWPLGVPEHIWMKTMPAPKHSGYSCWYQPVKQGTRGAWPCTYVSEAYGEDRYEAKFPPPRKED